MGDNIDPACGSYIWVIKAWMTLAKLQNKIVPLGLETTCTCEKQAVITEVLLWTDDSYKIAGELPSPSMEEHNSSAETPPPSQGRHSAIKCGWLRKQGGFVKTWHTRWFVLKGDQLYYFKDEDETKPLPMLAYDYMIFIMHLVNSSWSSKLAFLSWLSKEGTIFLPGNRVIEHPCNEESPGKFLFEVVPGKNRVYDLWKKGQAAQEDYMDVIRLCRENIRRTKAQLELNLATAIKDNKKCFCKYISNKRRAKENLHPLLDVGET
ncbi:hypothetical protein QYF61_010782 [Mycteria americana]|uniref:PH domain-containing protein n=1 Tax=Mycteria americana TaxID=33587 RepID=A0AAN7NM98_MYCAM|nr:hypothetical protein QYF61_010782 [Mycteria americana]